MGRCGPQTTTNDNDTYTFTLLLTLADFVYLNEQLYGEQNKHVNNTVCDIPFKVDHDHQREDLLLVLRAFFLSSKCIHCTFGDMISNPLVYDNKKSVPCKTKCHICTDKCNFSLLQYSDKG